jgi:hypothetical protein
MRSFGDWRPIRNAIEAAYREMGEDVPPSIPERDWNLAGLSITLHERASMLKCAECKEPFDNWHAVIRCLDCKAPLCERCAPRHFWPNGRPASEAASPRPAAADAGVREALDSCICLLETMAETAKERGDTAEWSMMSVMAENGRAALSLAMRGQAE